MRPYILAETTWKTVKETRYDAAILPWGATEAHNYHLPYATDVIQCDHIAAESAKRAWEAGAKVVVLPTIPFGVQTGQLNIPLCINMNPSTQAALLADVVHSLEVQGIKKLVVFNGHGGNDFRQIIRELQARTSVFLCALNWYQCADRTKFFEEGGDHADELETSVMMHLVPELVRPLAEAGNGATRTNRIKAMRDGKVWSPRPWTQVTADTGTGNPHKSMPEKGKAFIDAVADYIAAFLVEFAKADTNNLYE
jgi:creatinine amidohydrolase